MITDQEFRRRLERLYAKHEALFEYQPLGEVGPRWLEILERGAEDLAAILRDKPGAGVMTKIKARVQIRSATLINGLGGRDAIASEPLDRQVKVAWNELHT